MQRPDEGPRTKIRQRRSDDEPTIGQFERRVLESSIEFLWWQFGAEQGSFEVMNSAGCRLR